MLDDWLPYANVRPNHCNTPHCHHTPLTPPSLPPVPCCTPHNRYAKAAAQRYCMIAKEPVIDIDHILVSASAADYSPTIHAELGKVVAEELELREALRAAQQQQPKEWWRWKGRGISRRVQKAFSSYFERLMDTEMRQSNEPLSPPCAMCGRICHFSFALPSTCSSSSSSVSPVAAETAATSAAGIAAARRSEEGYPMRRRRWRRWRRR